jgi:hypothetical protein
MELAALLANSLCPARDQRKMRESQAKSQTPGNFVTLSRTPSNYTHARIIALK